MTKFKEGQYVVFVCSLVMFRNKQRKLLLRAALEIACQKFSKTGEKFDLLKTIEILKFLRAKSS